MKPWIAEEKGKNNPTEINNDLSNPCPQWCQARTTHSNHQCWNNSPTSCNGQVNQLELGRFAKASISIGRWQDPDCTENPVVPVSSPLQTAIGPFFSATTVKERGEDCLKRTLIKRESAMECEVPPKKGGSRLGRDEWNQKLRAEIEARHRQLPENTWSNELGGHRFEGECKAGGTRGV